MPAPTRRSQRKNRSKSSTAGSKPMSPAPGPEQGQPVGPGGVAPVRPKKKDNTPLIVGGVIGAAVLVVLIFAAIMVMGPGSGEAADRTDGGPGAVTEPTDDVGVSAAEENVAPAGAATADVPPVRPVATGAAAGVPIGGGSAEQDILAYLGGAGEQRLGAVLRLSDGTYLVGGGASDMAWVPDGVPVNELSGPMPEADEPTEMTPFLMHVATDLGRPITVWALRKGSAHSIDVIKTTSAPGAKTGTIFISGARPGGYFIARLDGNVLDAPPTKTIYCNSYGDSQLARWQPWDVGPDGKVVFARGNPYSYDWFSVHRLTPAGERDVVENWRTHWAKTPDGKMTEWYGAPASACDVGTVDHSGIVLKVWGRGDFRSWNKEDYLLKQKDGVGKTKQGKWPFDAMFDGYWDPKTKETVEVRDDGRGYYGYRWGSTPCGNVFAIKIDRRNGDLYIAGNNKSRLPDGNPDFEPWVVAMDQTGALRWWSRLYSEADGVSTPDQYADGLAIDYSDAVVKGGTLIVVGRAHGNNVNNFWNPSDITHPAGKKDGFQEGFTGTHGNMHFSWLGKLTLGDGKLVAATYFAEYAEGAKHQDKPFADPLIDHWPHWKAGWPDLNSTRYRYHTLHADAAGNVYVGALGRRVITTKNAHMEMPSPTQHPGSRGQWSDFVRCYTPHLTTLRYSSLVNGKWDWDTGKGGSPHEITGLTPIPGGLVVTGYSKLDKNTQSATGDDMPTKNVPDWLQADRTGEMGIVGRLHFEQK